MYVTVTVNCNNFQMMSCCSQNKDQDVDHEKQNKDFSENFKDNRGQDKLNQEHVNKKIKNNWKILPLMVDKVAFVVFCSLEIYFYFVYIPR